MAKQPRHTARSSSRTSRATPKAAAPPTRGTTRSTRGRSAPSPRRRAGPAVPPAPQLKPPVPPPAPPPRKPGYYEALAMYESGVRGLQRHDYEGAAAQFRSIIERYPEERELQERSQLYLRVCERETARRPPAPQTPQERVYAATVALNAGETTTALDHLRSALTDAPDSDHAHYIMAVALAATGSQGDALEHLRRAIALNAENRGLARQDPDLEPLRQTPGFADLVDTPPGASRPRPRKRR